MAHYIDKHALVAELERRINEYNTPIDRLGSNNIRLHECKDILSFLNTVEAKDVNLEKEYQEYVEEDPVYNKLVNGIVGKAIAKHFFELGLKTHKGE